MTFDGQGRFIPQSATPVAPSRPLGSVALPAATAQAAQQGTTVTGPMRPLNSNIQNALSPRAPQDQMQATPQPAAPQAPPAAVPTPARPQLGSPQQVYQPQPAQQAYQPQPQAPQQSVEQVASRGGAQSVQNFMSALNQVGAGGNNNMMNAPGQLGAGPQAGFQGFQTNGSYGPDFVQQGYTGPVQSQLGAYNNQASLNNNFRNTYSQGMNSGSYGRAATPQAWSDPNFAGGTGGVAGQPQWQTPQPWTQPGNSAPGQPGSYYADNSQGWQDYYNIPQGSYGKAPVQGGAFYSGAPPGSTNIVAGQNAPTTGGLTYDATQGPVDVSGEHASISDQRAKENISSAKGELEEFLDNLGVYSYEYKNKDHGEGRYISPMAQEFEKSKLGKQAVETDENGLKRVNYGRLIGVQSSALALVNQKINALEQKFASEVSKRVKARK